MHAPGASTPEPEMENAMLIGIDKVRLQLAKGDCLRLVRASRARLTTVSGIAWITVDREAEDILVRAGDSFVVPSDRAVVVGPLFSSLMLDIEDASDAMPYPQRWRSAAGETLRVHCGSMLRHRPCASGSRRLWAIARAFTEFFHGW